MLRCQSDVQHRTKTNKSKFILSALTYALFIAPSMAYDEPGRLGNISSWETPEYNKDWGLRAMNVSTAYALGVTGKDVKLGFMDSGLLLSHPQFEGNRFFAVKQSGYYGKDGMRYPDAAQGNGPNDTSAPVVWDASSQKYVQNIVTSDVGAFKKGERFDLDGSWIYGVNDSHGVNVASVLGANRDGTDIHGIAFNALIYSANTGGNDNMTYGPTQDYQFFLQGYNALAEQGVKFINNSWGSNRRLASAYEGATGWTQTWVWNYQTNAWEFKAVESNAPSAHMNLKDLDSAKKAYYQFMLTNEKGFIDSAYEVAKENKLVQIFTAGNRTGMLYPFTRAMLPYFRPDIENYWLNVTGQNGDQQYPNTSVADQHLWNESRGAKWWTIAAPAYHTRAAEVLYTDLTNLSDYGTAGYTDEFGGTSGAAPHVTASLGLIQERYPYLSPSQVRDVLLTTARQTKVSDSTTPLDSWTAPLGTLDDVWGWGIVDVSKAMFGPKQFLGTFDVSLDRDDLWSNDISEIALKYRKTEDDAEATEWTARKAELEAKATLTAEEKVELDVGNARAEARTSRQTQGYEGSLVKKGEGNLTLTGNNTFTGTTQVSQGKLTALNQSIGKSKQVLVENGASLEIVPTIEFAVPSTNGWQTETKSADTTQVKATIKEGGTFLVNDGVNNLSLTFEDNAIVKPANMTEAVLKNLAANPTSLLSYTATGEFVNADNTIVPNDYAFFDLTKNVENNSKLMLTLKSVDMEDVARSDNEKRIAQALKNNPNSNAYQELLFASKAQAKQLYDVLSNDKNFMVQDHTLMDTISLKNQVLNPDNVQRGQINANIDLWATTTLNRMNSNIKDKLTTKNLTQLLGVDVNLQNNNSVSVFAGAGKSKHESDDIQTLKGKQFHVGLYHTLGFDKATIKSGLIYSHYKQDLYAQSNVKNKANLTTLFTDIGYKVIDNANFSLEPYMGLSYTRVKFDDVKNDVVSIDNKARDVGIATVGLRPSIPFTLGSTNFALNADIGYHQLFGDKSTQANVQFSDLGPVQLYSKKWNNFVSSELGLEAALTPNMKLGLSYVGAYAKEIKSNGAELNLNILF